jgi:hypothetical protein
MKVDVFNELRRAHFVVVCPVCWGIREVLGRVQESIEDAQRRNPDVDFGISVKGNLDCQRCRNTAWVLTEAGERAVAELARLDHRDVVEVIGTPR